MSDSEIDSVLKKTLEEMREQITVRDLQIKLGELRLEKLEKLIQDHCAHCNRQREEMTQMLEIVSNLNASMKIANIVRKSVIWLASFIAAGWTLVQIFWKG